MVVEAAIDLSNNAFVHNNGDGSHAFLVETEWVVALRQTMHRLKELSPDEMKGYEPPENLG